MTRFLLMGWPALVEHSCEHNHAWCVRRHRIARSLSHKSPFFAKLRAVSILCNISNAMCIMKWEIPEGKCFMMQTVLTFYCGGFHSQSIYKIRYNCDRGENRHNNKLCPLVLYMRFRQKLRSFRMMLLLGQRRNQFAFCGITILPVFFGCWWHGGLWQYFGHFWTFCCVSAWKFTKKPTPVASEMSYRIESFLGSIHFLSYNDYFCCNKFRRTKFAQPASST